MPEEWLLDGYNLLHYLQIRDKNKTKISRDRFFQLVAGFASGGGRRVFCVLDGYGSKEEWRSLKTANFQIFYSKSVSADTAIEKYLYENKDKAHFVVVTHDRAITHMARGSGARVLGAEEFIRLLEENQKENSDILFKHQARSHGFNRPFNEKLK